VPPESPFLNWEATRDPDLKNGLKERTAALSDTSISYGLRIHRCTRLIQAQEGVVRVQSDGSIATPVDPDDTNDAIEYLERLKQIKVPR
jgi:hypothetical protein